MVHVRDVLKYYGGKRALGPVSFEIAAGETVGFLGLNGVGKTTLLRILACDLRPSAGAVHVGGVDALRDSYEVRKRVGFLPEVPPVYQDMTVRDYLTFVGRLRGMDAGALATRLPKVREATHLEAVWDELVRHLSQGYRQRVGVAQAIVHEPDLLILDEPTHDLDPVQIVEMRSMIRNLRERHTILISSHILAEISETCDRVLVLSDGAIIASGSEAELSARFLETRRVAVTLRPKEGSEEPETCLRRVDGVREVELAGRADGTVTFHVLAGGDRRAEVCRVLVEAGHDVLRLQGARRELEETFLQLVRGRGGETTPSGAGVADADRYR